MEYNKTVLIIDDSNTALLLMDFSLKEAGFKTQLASSVKQAIENISSQKPDIILLDLSMPEITGYDFLKMKFELNLENVPIIIISALDSKESIQATKNLGAIDFIAKPVKIDFMVERIKHHCGF